MRSDIERLKDILEAIDKIQQKMKIEKSAFFQDEMLQIWVIHYIQIIGEAASRLSFHLRDLYPQIPWLDITSMRNVLVHQYIGIDLQKIWDTVL